MTTNKEIQNYEEKENVQMEEEVLFDLENAEDLANLSEEINKNNMYFKPETDVTYKLQLTATTIQKVEKDYNGETKTKYVIGVKTLNANNEEFVGIWEVGISVIKPIVKNYESLDTIFKITKTGTGTDTRYSVIKDF